MNAFVNNVSFDSVLNDNYLKAKINICVCRLGDIFSAIQHFFSVHMRFIVGKLHSTTIETAAA